MFKAISALCIAISMITKVWKKLKHEREIILMADVIGLQEIEIPTRDLSDN